MKKYFAYLLPAAAMLVLAACTKETNLDGGIKADVAYVAFTHAAPATAFAPTAGRVVNVLADGNKLNLLSPITYNLTTNSAGSATQGAYAYVALQPGTRNITVNDTLSSSTINYFTGSVTVEGGKSYSVFVYDTLTAGKYRALVLTNDRTPADGDKAGIRFLHLSPNAPPVDVFLFRRNGAAIVDSARVLSSVNFVGPNPPASVLSNYANVPAATYNIVVRRAGTFIAVASATGVNLINTKKYTIYARGLVGGAGGNALGASIILNN